MHETARSRVMRRYNLYVNWYPRGDIEGAANADNLTYANYGTASSPYLKVRGWHTRGGRSEGSKTATGNGANGQ